MTARSGRRASSNSAARRATAACDVSALRRSLQTAQQQFALDVAKRRPVPRPKPRAPGRPADACRTRGGTCAAPGAISHPRPPAAGRRPDRRSRRCILGRGPRPQIGQLRLQPTVAADEQRLVDRLELDPLRAPGSHRPRVRRAAEIMLEGGQGFAGLFQADGHQPQIACVLLLLIDQLFQLGRLATGCPQNRFASRRAGCRPADRACGRRRPGRTSGGTARWLPAACPRRA